MQRKLLPLPGAFCAAVLRDATNSAHLSQQVRLSSAVPTPRTLTGRPFAPSKGHPHSQDAPHSQCTLTHKAPFAHSQGISSMFGGSADAPWRPNPLLPATPMQQPLGAAPLR
eukprot:scaffold266960_cov24-Tisochrysis_lutea.AAC.1